jgi:hypothetical protein
MEEANGVEPSLASRSGTAMNSFLSRVAFLRTNCYDRRGPSHKNSCSDDLWALQPTSNPPKEIPVGTFNNLALFEATDYAY